MTSPPAGRFMDDLARLGLEPRLEAGLVVFTVEPVEGPRAGTEVDTGVAVDELARWPQVPPHWVHLPADITFRRTNSRPSSLAGWLTHSRQISGWGRDADPTQAWLGHVRGIVGQATS